MRTPQEETEPKALVMMSLILQILTIRTVAVSAAAVHAGLIACAYGQRQFYTENEPQSVLQSGGFIHEDLYGKSG